VSLTEQSPQLRNSTERQPVFGRSLPTSTARTMRVGKTLSVGGLIVFGTITSLFAKVGECVCVICVWLADSGACH
jgi:hypothetical protein